MTAEHHDAARAPLAEEERAAALRAGRAPVPRRFIYWIIVGAAVLGLGGALADHLIGNGSATTPSALAENTGGTNGVPGATPTTTFVPGTQTTVAGPRVSSSLASFLSLKNMHNDPAPAIRLTTLAGRTWSLAAARGRTVVLTFANADCSDFCPVLAKEVAKAETDLGGAAASTMFVVVNTNPLETGRSPTPALLTTSLGRQPNVVYLTGSIAQLNPVWSAYGVTIVVQRTTRTASHNDILYIINGRGRMTYRLTPFANETPQGEFSLDKADIARFSSGLAHYVALTRAKG